ncbi:MAG: alpha/beta hydrolase [Verrucomicrobiota bacterium]
MSGRYYILVFTLLFSSLSAPAKELDFLKPNEVNVIYGMDHGTALLMDIYEPKEPNGYALVFVMGTGFTAYGGYDDLPLKELDRWLLKNGVFENLMGEKRQIFAPAVEAGFTVFSINHRLAPKNHWQDQVRDVQRAVQFIRSNSAAYGVSSDWIAGMGHSSGGSLVALAAALDDVMDPYSIDRVDRESSRFQAVVPVSGVHDLLSAMKERPSITTMLSGYVGQVISYQPPGHQVYKAFMQASPVYHLDESDPPMLVIHCADDDVISVEQSVALASKLEELSIPHEFHSLADGDHGAVFDLSTFQPMPYAAEWLVKELPAE